MSHHFGCVTGCLVHVQGKVLWNLGSTTELGFRSWNEVLSVNRYMTCYENETWTFPFLILLKLMEYFYYDANVYLDKHLLKHLYPVLQPIGRLFPRKPKVNENKTITSTILTAIN